MAQAAVQPGQQGQSSQAGAKVVVACKMPTGIIIRGFVERTEAEPVLGGGMRDVKIFRESGESHTIRGTAVRIGATPPILFGGYRLTPNVSKDLWDQWRKANADSDMVKNRLIFAHEDERRVEDEAKGYSSVETGLEGIDPDKPGKRIRGNIERMERPK